LFFIVETSLLNSESIHSFNYDSDTWDLLKKTYKNSDLSMPCCGVSAIPKTSKLKNYFLHIKKQGECVTAPETAEHLYLKTLIDLLHQNIIIYTVFSILISYINDCQSFKDWQS
jgi:hypothetical protein